VQTKEHNLVQVTETVHRVDQGHNRYLTFIYWYLPYAAASGAVLDSSFSQTTNHLVVMQPVGLVN